MGTRTSVKSPFQKLIFGNSGQNFCKKQILKFPGVVQFSLVFLPFAKLLAIACGLVLLLQNV